MSTVASIIDQNLPAAPHPFLLADTTSLGARLYAAAQVSRAKIRERHEEIKLERQGRIDAAIDELVAIVREHRDTIERTLLESAKGTGSTMERLMTFTMSSDEHLVHSVRIALFANGGNGGAIVAREKCVCIAALHKRDLWLFMSKACAELARALTVTIRYRASASHACQCSTIANAVCDKDTVVHFYALWPSSTVVVGPPPLKRAKHVLR